MRRAVWLVLDSFGLGAAPDAADYGDAGADTYGHIAAACAAAARGPLRLPELERLGLAHAHALAHGLAPPPLAAPQGLWGYAQERACGKDTPSGHWESLGVVLQQPLGLFPPGDACFPPELLEALVRDTLPPGVYEFQAAVGGGREKADCVLTMPDGTSRMAIDSKFPLSNYRMAIDAALPEAERATARKQFATDVKKHINDIAGKYIQPGAGADSAVMFIPSEAVFAEIVGNHPEIVAQAQAQRVWMTSPTNLMAVLHTVRAVLRDAEMRHTDNAEPLRMGDDLRRIEVPIRGRVEPMVIYTAEKAAMLSDLIADFAVAAA